MILECTLSSFKSRIEIQFKFQNDNHLNIDAYLRFFLNILD